jgi:hypothetical protein
MLYPLSYERVSSIFNEFGEIVKEGKWARVKKVGTLYRFFNKPVNSGFIGLTRALTALGYSARS